MNAWWHTPKGYHMLGSIKRVANEERWGQRNCDLVKFVPWHRYRGDPQADGDIPEGVPAPALPTPVGDRVVYIETRKVPPRDFYITFKDIGKYGATRGCGGCAALQRGRGLQPHTDECRARFQSLMRDSAKVTNAEKRKREFEGSKGEKGSEGYSA